MELVFLRFLNKPIVIWFLETRLVSWVLELFLPWLERNDPLPTDHNSVKFIFLASYAATSTRLTTMSRNTTKLAVRLARLYPKAKIIWGDFRDNPEGANEWMQKVEILPSGRWAYADKVSSTTDEEKILVRRALDFSGNINHSIVVASGSHIRRVAMVWNYYHPLANLCFRSTDAKNDDDLDNPMIAQRRWQVWEVANLVGLLFYKILGVKYFAKKNPSQPVD